jgi:hypothetical protein
MNESQVFDDVDSAIRATLKGIGAKYMTDGEAGNFAICALVPILCAAIEEIAKSVPAPLRQAWAKELYRTADRLVAVNRE